MHSVIKWLLKRRDRPLAAQVVSPAMRSKGVPASPTPMAVIAPSQAENH